jgi:K+/H+ antiporter YhaU regulatory subunit KhtT
MASLNESQHTAQISIETISNPVSIPQIQFQNPSDNEDTLIELTHIGSSSDNQNQSLDLSSHTTIRTLVLDDRDISRFRSQISDSYILQYVCYLHHYFVDNVRDTNFTINHELSLYVKYIYDDPYFFRGNGRRKHFILVLRWLINIVKNNKKFVSDYLKNYNTLHDYKQSLEKQEEALSFISSLVRTCSDKNNKTEPQMGLFDFYPQPYTEEEESSFKIVKDISKEYINGNIDSTIGNITEAVAKVETIIGKLPAEDLTALVKKLNTLLGEKAETPKDSKMYFFTALFVFVASTIMALKDKNPVYIILAITSGIFMTSTDYFRGIISSISNIASSIAFITKFITRISTEKTSAQFGFDDLQMVCQSIGTIFIGILVKDSPLSKMPAEIYKNVCQWERFSGNLTSIIKNLVDSVQEIYQYILKLTVGSEDCSFIHNWIETNDKFIDQYVKDVNEIIHESATFKLRETQDTFTRITSLVQRGETLSLSFKGRSVMPHVLRAAIQRVDKLRDKFSQVDFSSTGLRAEPVFLLLIGGAGIGKSVASRQLTHYLVGSLMETDGDKREYVNNCDHYIYYRKAGEEYWEGFNSQHKAAVYDDIHQATDTQGSTFSEALEVIHTVNSEPFKPNMAFGDKGKVFFRCKLMVASTNVITPKFETINHSEAYFRRCKHAYLCYPKEEYTLESTKGLDVMNRKVDFSKLKKDDKGEPELGYYALHFMKIKYSYDGSYEYEYLTDGDEIKQNLCLQMRKNQLIFEQQARILKKERMQALDDESLRLAATQPQSYIKFNADERHYEEDYLMSFLDEIERPDKRPIESFTQLDVDIVNDYIRKVSSKSNQEADWFYIHCILTRVYTTCNRYTCDEPRIEEVFLAFYTRFGTDFTDLLKNPDKKEFLSLVNTLVMAHGKFDRKFNRVIAPDLHLSGYGKFLATLSAIKKSLYTTFVKDSWIEQIYIALCVYVEQNPFVSYVIGGALVFQLIISAIQKLFVIPVIREFNHEMTENRIQYEKWITLDNIIKDIWNPLDRIEAITRDENFSSEDKLRYILAISSGTYEKELEDALDEYDAIQKKRLVSKMKKESSKDIVINPLPPDENGDYVPQSMKTKERNKSKKVNMRFKNTARAGQIAQMGLGLDPNGDDIMMKIVSNNMYMMQLNVLHERDEYQDIGLLTFVCDKYAIIPEHYILKFYSMIENGGEEILGSLVKLTQCGSNKNVTHIVTLAQFLGIRSLQDEVVDPYFKLPSCKDICLIQLDIEQLGIGIRKNIIKYFCSTDQYNNLASSTSGVIISPRLEATNMCLIQAKKGIRDISYSVESPEGTAIFTPTLGFTYHAPTTAGDCGALIGLNKPRLGAARIFGVHVAGTVGLFQGHAELVTSNDLETTLAMFKDDSIVHDEFNETRPHCGIKISDGQFTPLEYLEEKVPMNYRSSIRASPLSGLFFPPTEGIAPLKPTLFNDEIVDPWDHNLRKFCKNNNTLIPRQVIEDIADQMYADLLHDSPVQVDKRLLTFEEAVLGEDIFDLGSIPRDTSPGYPDVLHPVPGLPKSTRYFGREQNYNLDNPYCDELRIRIDNYISNCKVNIRNSEILAIDNLKDQVVDKIKIETSLKNRIFNAYPKMKLITDKMYYGAFVSFLNKNAITNGFAIGTNPFSKEWDLIARRLLCFGDANIQNIGAGDYSCFDGSQLSIILNILHARIICKWFGRDGDNRIRKMLFLDVSDSYHIRGNIIYQWNGGMTSGSYLTIIMNCLYNSFAYYFTWYHIHNYERGCLFFFRDNVVYVILGDDNAFSVSAQYVEIFTERTMSESLVHIGLTYTSEVKDGTHSSLRKIGDIEFLKRGFRYTQEHGWIAPMRLNSILEDVYWSRHGAEYYDISRDKVDVLFKELALHGEEVFNRYADVLHQASLERLNHSSRFCVYSVALNAVLSLNHFF